MSFMPYVFAAYTPTRFVVKARQADAIRCDGQAGVGGDLNKDRPRLTIYSETEVRDLQNQPGRAALREAGGVETRPDS